MAYNKINWENFPGVKTPINSENLNKMDNQIKLNSDKLDGINDIINSYLGIETLPKDTNLNNFYLEKGVKIYRISGSGYKGLPSGAYEYGALIVITTNPEAQNYYTNCQIYITDGIHNSETYSDRGLYIRARNGAWLKITGTKREATT